MNINGYQKVEQALASSFVDAQIDRCPDENEDRRYFNVDVEIEQSSGEQITSVSSVLEVLSNAGLLDKLPSRSLETSYGPELEVVGFTEYTIVFRDLNWQPPGSVELR